MKNMKVEIKMIILKKLMQMMNLFQAEMFTLELLILDLIMYNKPHQVKNNMMILKKRILKENQRESQRKKLQI